MASTIIRGAVLALALAGPAFGQTSPAPGSPPPAAGGPPSAPAATPPAPPSGAAQSLVPSPADPTNPDEVTLPSRPALVLSGTSSWDEGFNTLKGAFERLNEEIRRAGLKPAGRPLVLFSDTDPYTGFRYEAMIPVEGGAPANLGPDIRLGRTPDGRAVRFVHQGTYEDIDTTHEMVTAYLGTKGIASKDSYIEEYLTDLTNPGDPIEVNIYALPR